MCPRLRRLELPSLKGAAAVANGVISASGRAEAGEGAAPALKFLLVGDEGGPRYPPTQLVDVLAETLGTLETVGPHSSFYRSRDRPWPCFDVSYLQAWMEAVERRQRHGLEGAPALR